MPRVTYFELGSDMPERALEFYSKTFGWAYKKMENLPDYWLLSTGEKEEPGINGAIFKRDESSDSTINTIDVDSIDDYIRKILENGGSVLSQKIIISGVGHFAYCADTEGNKFGIIHRDPNVK